MEEERGGKGEDNQHVFDEVEVLLDLWRGVRRRRWVAWGLPRPVEFWLGDLFRA